MRSKNEPGLGSPPPTYLRLLRQLAQPRWLAHGTVVCRPLRRRVRGRWINKGPYYLWTSKQEGKTICYALSKAQYQLAKEAIAANRQLMKSLAKLQAMTLHRIRQTVPGVKKRK
jgi:hypothetical protein